MANKPPLTEFDIVTIPSSFQIMKAMLPFLDINLQKKFIFNNTVYGIKTNHRLF